MDDLELRLCRLEARGELENLVGRYFHHLFSGEGDAIVREIWAQRREDVSLEIGASGPYIGLGKLATFYQKDHLAGVFSLLMPTAPVIEVAGDGQSAKGMWFGIGLETDAGDLSETAVTDPERRALLSSHTEDGKCYQAEWMFQRVGFDFLREGGEWRVLRLHIYEIARCPHDRDWVRYAAERFETDGRRLDAMFKSNLPFPEDGPPENLASGPTGYHWQYTTDGKTEMPPAFPHPFATEEETEKY